MNENDYEQLEAWKRHIKPTAELTRVEGRLLAEQEAHRETKRQLDAVNTSLAQALQALEKLAPQTWREIVGVDDVRPPVECGDGLPPFLVKARRDRMRQIWLEVNGGKS